MLLDEEAGERTKESVGDMGSHLSTAQPLTGQRRWGAMAKIFLISCKAVILCGSSTGTCTCALQKNKGCGHSSVQGKQGQRKEKPEMGFHTLERKIFPPAIAVDNLGRGAVGWQLRVQLVQPPVGFQLLISAFHGPLAE